MTTIKDLSTINWSDFRTVYGSAEEVPKLLADLFSGDKKNALDATHELWCGLCHQKAYISSAALPAYDFLKIALLTLDDEIKIEVLDIIEGFSGYTQPKSYRVNKLKINDWEMELRNKLQLDKEIFKELSNNPNEEISYFAVCIVDNLENTE